MTHGEPLREHHRRTTRTVVAAVVVTVVALGATALVLLTRDGSDGGSPGGDAGVTTVPAGLPTGWPLDAVPVFGPSTIVSSARTDAAGGTFFGITLAVEGNDGVRQGYLFYRRVLSPPAFALQVDTPNETAYGFYANLVAVDDVRTVNVVADTDGDTVVVSLSPRGAS